MLFGGSQAVFAEAQRSYGLQGRELLFFPRANHGANGSIWNLGTERRTSEFNRAFGSDPMVCVVRHRIGFVDLLRPVLGYFLAHDHRARHVLDTCPPPNSIRWHPRRGHLHLSYFLDDVLP